MQASPIAAIIFIAGLVLISANGGSGTNPAVVTAWFLFFVPAWLVGEYIWDALTIKPPSDTVGGDTTQKVDHFLNQS